MLRPLLIALLTLTGGSETFAQDARPISEGQTLTGALSSDSEHDFTIRLDDEQFVFGFIDQVSVDVVVTVLGPDGEEIEDWDGPARGPENFQFTTEVAGTFIIRVVPFEEQEGDYAITLEKAERVASDPDDRIDQIMTRFTGEDTPGAVVGVVKGGDVVFKKAYGMASLEYGIPHRVDTPTNIGSVTKQFTAMAILLLQKDGKLSLEDDVRKHIPELPDFGETVTLKNMLNHTTGYREIYNFLPMAGHDGEDGLSRDMAIEIVQRQPELQDAPNTLYNYNNTSFILLATIVERISGQTFPEFMEERVFEPLGMNDTRVKYAQGEVIPGASRGYVPAEGAGWRAVRDLGASAGAGGIYTTFADMTQWMANYRDGTVGGKEAIDLLTTPNILADGDSTAYALGLGVRKLRGLDVYTHTGGDVAHRTFFSYFPELDGGIFISSNASNFDGTVARTVTDLYFEEYMDPEAGDGSDENDGGSEAGSMSTARMEAITGKWMVEGPGLISEFLLEDETLYAHPSGQDRVALTVTSDSTVEASALSVAVVFHFEEDGSVDRATFTQGGQAAAMTRVTDLAMTIEEMGVLEGRYFSRELDLWVDVGIAKLEEGDEAEGPPGLELRRLGMEPVGLRHNTGTTFGGPFPFITVEFERTSNGAITGFLAGNGRTKGVLFERR